MIRPGTKVRSTITPIYGVVTQIHGDTTTVRITEDRFLDPNMRLPVGDLMTDMSERWIEVE